MREWLSLHHLELRQQKVKSPPNSKRSNLLLIGLYNRTVKTPPAAWALSEVEEELQRAGGPSPWVAHCAGPTHHPYGPSKGGGERHTGCLLPSPWKEAIFFGLVSSRCVTIKACLNFKLVSLGTRARCRVMKIWPWMTPCVEKLYFLQTLDHFC